MNAHTGPLTNFPGTGLTPPSTKAGILAVEGTSIIPPSTPMSDIPPEEFQDKTPSDVSQREINNVDTVLGVATDQGGRAQQEDRFTLVHEFGQLSQFSTMEGFFKGGRWSHPSKQLMAVYDGHASEHGSEHAARRLHEIISRQEAVKACKGIGDEAEMVAMEEALITAFEQADTEIIHEAEKRGRRYGTTAVVALRIGGVVYVAHAGDSRAVLCRAGKALTLTRDHKPASVPEERARIQEQGGKISYNEDRVYSNPESGHMSRLNMSRALGDAGHKSPRRLVESSPDVACIKLHPNDQFLVLGSDGLFDVMAAMEVAAVVTSTLGDASPQGQGPLNTQGSKEVNKDMANAAAEALVQHALSKGTRDNVTAAVMLFKW